jgi:hypothetical protein
MIFQPGVMVHVFNPSTQEAKTGELESLGQSGLYSKTVSQKRKINLQSLKIIDSK